MSFYNTCNRLISIELFLSTDAAFSSPLKHPSRMWKIMLNGV